MGHTLTELLARVDRGVEIGVLDEDDAKLMRAQLAEAFKPLDAAPEPTPQGTPDKPWLEGFEPPAKNGPELLVRNLMERGESEANARRYAMNPDMDMSEVIDREYAAEVEAAESEAKAKWLRTPDGKRYQAQEALAAQKQRAEDVELSRALLQSQGVPIDGLTDDELLSVAALDQADPEDLSDNYAANVKAALAETPQWGADAPAEGEGGESSAA